MQTSRFHSMKQVMTAMLLSVALTATIHAGAYASDTALPSRAALRNNGLLVIHRVADFGTLIYLNLSIDGVHATTLGLNERYEALLRPGHHVLSIGTSPSPYGHTKFTRRDVIVKRGGTSEFTALWSSDRAVLEPGDGAKYRRQLVW
ncbi:MAG: hypothetical protein ABJB69_07205 [Spartobacteria bacterium]